MMGDLKGRSGVTKDESVARERTFSSESVDKPAPPPLKGGNSLHTAVLSVALCIAWYRYNHTATMIVRMQECWEQTADCALFTLNMMEIEGQGTAFTYVAGALFVLYNMRPRHIEGSRAFMAKLLLIVSAVVYASRYENLPNGCILSTLVWLAAYTSLALGLQHWCNGAIFEWSGVKCALWTFYASLFHNSIGIGIHAVLLYLTTDVGMTYMTAGWSELSRPLGDGVEVSVWGCILGCMLRDMLLVEVELNLPFVAMFVHHVFTIAGCVLCLAMPAAMGIAATNGILAELTSGIYSVYIIMPQNSPLLKWGRITYWITMTAGHIHVLRTLYWLESIEHLSTFYYTIYASIMYALVFLRQGTVFMSMYEAWTESRKEKVN